MGVLASAVDSLAPVVDLLQVEHSLRAVEGAELTGEILLPSLKSCLGSIWQSAQSSRS